MNFYHITYKDKLDKIMKMGLIPKESNSVFCHGGSRIYLFETDDIDVLLDYKDILSENKKLFRIKNNIKIRSETMIILLVDISGLSVYDDIICKGEGFCSVYVKENIKPNKLSLTNY